jgi:hypothetical protein
MAKKKDDNHKYGNPNPVQHPRNAKGQYCKLAGSLTNKAKYANKKKPTVSIALTRPQHHLLRHVTNAIGVSIRAFATTATLLHLNIIVQELAIKTGERIE